jgi:hypothetical protein
LAQPRLPATDDTLTIVPCPAVIMSGTATRLSRKTARKLTAKTRPLGLPAAEQPSPRESLAVAFAEAAAMDHAAISGGQLEVLLEEFTVRQVVELLTWIVFEHAGQMFGGARDRAGTERLPGRGRRGAAAAGRTYTRGVGRLVNSPMRGPTRRDASLAAVARRSR